MPRRLTQSDWWAIGLLSLCILLFGVWLRQRRGGGALEGFETRRAGTVVTFSQGFIKCTAQMVGSKGVRQFLCETEEDAARLMNGPTDKTQTYLGPADFVCIKVPDSKPAQFYCKDLDLPPDAEDVRYGMMDTYTGACDLFGKTYLDLSNNLTNLINMRDTVNFTTAQLGATSKGLTDLKGQLGCSKYAPSTLYGAVCAKIDAAATTIGGDRDMTNKLLGEILTPVTTALTLRDSAQSNLTQFRCPS